MRIPINNRYRPPSWKEVFGDRHDVSFRDYMDALGTRMYKVVGNIGYTGTKVHLLVLEAVETPEGLGIVNAMSLCGSQKYGSQLRVSASDDMSLITCERCLKRMGM